MTTAYCSLPTALCIPFFFAFWNFPINTYGVFLALAFLGAIFVTVKLAERDGLPKERIYDLCLWLLISSLVGSKLLMFFTEPEYRAESVATFLSGFSAFGRRVLRRPDRGIDRRLFSDASLEVAVVEDGGRLRAGHCAGQCAGPPGLFFSRMLLGQTDESAVGRAL